VAIAPVVQDVEFARQGHRIGLLCQNIPMKDAQNYPSRVMDGLLFVFNWYTYHPSFAIKDFFNGKSTSLLPCS
jgi:hypothetical protein